MSVEVARIGELLNPRSLALVGASDRSRWCQGFLENLTSFGPFPGPVHLVNPRRGTVLGRACYPSIAELPDPVDHAVLLVPADRVPDVLVEMGEAEVRSGTVIAAGFNEGDGSGTGLAREVVRLCARYDIALLGPNCYGFNNYLGSLVSNYPQVTQPLAGQIGVTTQSAALGAAVADSAVSRGIRLRYLVSTGNELVTDTNDYFEYFLESRDVTVLGAVLERIPEPGRFAALARRALAAGKPIVALKLGRSAAAQRVAVAHTGSIAGVDAIADAYLRDLGVIRVDSPEELAETTGILARRAWPGGRRTAFIGYSGGAAELFAEQAEGTELELPEFAPATRDRLAQAARLDRSVIHNPFDMTADGGRKNYARIVEVLAADPAIDIVVSQGAVKRSSVPDAHASWRPAREAGLMATAEQHGKYALLLETGDHQPGIEAFPHIPAGGAHYVLGHTGVKALGKVAEYGARRAALLADTGSASEAPGQRPVLTAALQGIVAEREAKSVLRAYGIPTTVDMFASDREAAAEAATELGFPVVLKAASSRLSHKSEVGGVVVGLGSADDVRTAFDAVVATVARHDPAAASDGVLITRQVDDGVEFFAGIASDPVLGPVVVAGLGGVYVEVLADRGLALPPLRPERARALLEGLRSAPILHGARGRPTLDVAAFVDVLCRLGRLALDLADKVIELDINPLFVRPEGCGVVAGDALIVCRTSAETEKS